MQTSVNEMLIGPGRTPIESAPAWFGRRSRADHGCAPGFDRDSKGLDTFSRQRQQSAGLLRCGPACQRTAEHNGRISPVAKAVTPAVVTIRTESRARNQRTPLFIDPFREFFGNPDQDDEQLPRRRQTPQQQNPQSPQSRGRLLPSGVGSGILVSPDGYILTNNHVVEGAEKVTVELNDRRPFSAKVIGTDPPSDIAVLKIEATGLPTLPLGDSAQVEVGDVVPGNREPAQRGSDGDDGNHQCKEPLDRYRWWQQL